MDEIVACAKDSRFLKQVIGLRRHRQSRRRNSTARPSTSRLQFEAVRTGRERSSAARFHLRHDGRVPKGGGHDAFSTATSLIIADGYAKEVLQVTPEDVFVGLAAFGVHLRARRSGCLPVALWGRGPPPPRPYWKAPPPPNMIDIIETYKATISFTANRPPTAP